MGCITFPSRHGEDGAGSMLTTDLYQLTIILVLLIALASWLILRGEAERAGRRFLLWRTFVVASLPSVPRIR
jgi:hypothetical protein